MAWAARTKSSAPRVLRSRRSDKDECPARPARIVGGDHDIAWRSMSARPQIMPATSCISDGAQDSTTPLVGCAQAITLRPPAGGAPGGMKIAPDTSIGCRRSRSSGTGCGRRRPRRTAAVERPDPEDRSGRVEASASFARERAQPSTKPRLRTPLPQTWDASDYVHATPVLIAEGPDHSLNVWPFRNRLALLRPHFIPPSSGAKSRLNA